MDSPDWSQLRALLLPAAALAGGVFLTVFGLRIRQQLVVDVKRARTAVVLAAFLAIVWAAAAIVISLSGWGQGQSPEGFRDLAISAKRQLGGIAVGMHTVLLLLVYSTYEETPGRHRSHYMTNTAGALLGLLIATILFLFVTCSR